jgi:protein-tyrosine-phosphatase
LRDGLPAIALVISVVSLVVSLAGLVSGGAPDDEQSPKELLEETRRALDITKDRRADFDRELARLREEVKRAVEVGPPAEDQEKRRVEMENVVRAVVREEMMKRLTEKAEEVGAGAPKLAAEQQFDDMVREMKRVLSLDDAKAPAVGNVLEGLRKDLNDVLKASLPEPAAKQKFAEARRKADGEMARILGPGGYQEYRKWIGESKGDYVRRFFGLAP